MTPLPYEIIEAMIQCFGRCFHFKDRMAAFFKNCEVPVLLIDRHRQEYKFIWARKLLTDLGETESGGLLQRKVLTALCQLRRNKGVRNHSQFEIVDGLEAALEQFLLIANDLGSNSSEKVT